MNPYNQGPCDCNYCPWWLWLILSLLVIGALIAGLFAAFGGKRHRRHGRRPRNEIVERDETSYDDEDEDTYERRAPVREVETRTEVNVQRNPARAHFYRM